ncbi:Pkinase domain-containing protein/Usp domain-containing protein [Cephalotus follicularis]|uniref:Pkinase domain-containing protein/Usp domain-containing protein n=1 Tax=Cephalotus follicularis TaxID=3775 RepID=A0A1Q3BMH2_CEPFO|nr:Pkinase domain-containing protein/Usp domain-containing protein [Cephalotus follicularis]
MKLIGDRTISFGDGDGDGDGKTVIVGVKFDAQSRELLTWALVKVAQPGDRIIALHVLDTFTESTGSLLSLVKTFDSMLAVYEGFCNLKQVDLKLKLCRGAPVRQILVRDVKAWGASDLIVGISKTHRRLHSSISLAKYCARKLSKDFGVYAVENSRIMFQREATQPKITTLEVKSSQESGNCLQISCSDRGRESHKENCMSFDLVVVQQDNSGTQPSEGHRGNCHEDSTLALVPIQSSVALASSKSIIVRQFPRAKHGWPMLSQVLSTKWHHSKKSSEKNNSVVQRVFRQPSRQSSALVYPDQKHIHSGHKDYHCNLEGENDEIVPVGFACLPHSPYSGLPKELEGLHEKHSSACRLFSYRELTVATSNFIPGNIVGRGGCSHVYKGHLPDGKELAVKILKPSEDVLKEFLSEIEILTTLHHKNIISLFGFCFESNNLLLVYDFLSRGSLEENLYGNKKDRNAFGLWERYKVAVGVAEALDYLHNGCAEPVIHRDVKSSNILLSDDFEPQLSDFGLASRVSTSLSNVTCTDVAGTFGYLAPEYFMHGYVSDKMDVYAYGVVLLELLSGRKPISSECLKGQESLVMWAKPILNGGKISQLLDPCLDGDFDDDHFERMVLSAKLCIRSASKSRPQISLLLKLLRGDEEVINWARHQVNASEELDLMDGKVNPTNIQSHLNLALLDLEDNSLSISSTDQSVSVQDYLQGRWSRTSSFD